MTDRIEAFGYYFDTIELKILRNGQAKRAERVKNTSPFMCFSIKSRVWLPFRNIRQIAVALGRSDHFIECCFYNKTLIRKDFLVFKGDTLRLNPRSVDRTIQEHINN